MRRWLIDRFVLVKTDDAADLPEPSYMTEGASGMDLYANVQEKITLLPGEYRLIPTGI